MAVQRDMHYSYNVSCVTCRPVVYRKNNIFQLHSHEFEIYFMDKYICLFTGSISFGSVMLYLCGSFSCGHDASYRAQNSKNEFYSELCTVGASCWEFIVDGNCRKELSCKLTLGGQRTTFLVRLAT